MKVTKQWLVDPDGMFEEVTGKAHADWRQGKLTLEERDQIIREAKEAADWARVIRNKQSGGKS